MEFIMSRCNRCKIEIYDDTLICPLCNSVVSADGGPAGEVSHGNPDMDETDEYDSHSVMYPDITPAMRRMKFIVKLVVFMSVLVEGILIVINYNTGSSVKWSAVCGAGLAYICFTLIYSFMYNRGHRRKIMFQAVGVMVLSIAIDWVLGFQGWSLSFAIPCTLLAVDIAVLVMMLVNHDSFQLYIMMQIYTTVFSIVLVLVMFATGLAKFMVLAFVAMGISVVMLAGTVVFGDKKASSELKRRFRV
jgi:hypothetical protein